MNAPYAHLIRQWDLIPLAALDKKVTVIGAGAVGSLLVIELAKMGFSSIEVWDFDTVSVENLSSQWYPRGFIGRPKTEALREVVEYFTGDLIAIRTERYESGLLDPGIIVTAVDSMATRRAIWEAHKRRSFDVVIVDPRMSAETGLIFVMHPGRERDIAEYEHTLYSDEAAMHEKCTAKATMYCAGLLASQTAKIIRDLAVGDRPVVRTLQWSVKEDHMKAWK